MQAPAAHRWPGDETLFILNSSGFISLLLSRRLAQQQKCGKILATFFALVEIDQSP